MSVVTQPSPAPTRKVTAGVLAGAVVTIGTWVAGQFGVTIPAEVASSLVVLISFGASYLVRERA